ncbi:hypothetical protein BDQ17DRAFT_1423539 [Cyathus striatus]|nr:hypothetical protein BDQ17DRAFT_1423539 [Cyathus striatus]
MSYPEQPASNDMSLYEQLQEIERLEAEDQRKDEEQRKAIEWELQERREQATEDKRKEEERIAEEAREVEEAQKAEEAQRVEETRIAEEARRSETLEVASVVGSSKKGKGKEKNCTLVRSKSVVEDSDKEEEDNGKATDNEPDPKPTTEVIGSEVADSSKGRKSRPIYKLSTKVCHRCRVRRDVKKRGDCKRIKDSVLSPCDMEELVTTTVPNKKKRKAGSAESNDEDEDEPEPNCEQEADAGLQGKLLCTMQWMVRDQWELLREVQLVHEAQMEETWVARLATFEEQRRSTELQQDLVEEMRRAVAELWGVRQELTTLQGQYSTPTQQLNTTTTPGKFKAPESSDEEDDRKPKSPGLGRTTSQIEGGSLNPFASIPSSSRPTRRRIADTLTSKPLLSNRLIVPKPQITTPEHFFSEEPTPTQRNPTQIPEDLLASELVEYLKQNQPKNTESYETADEGLPPLPESPSEPETDISMSTQETPKTNDKELRLNPPSPFEGDKKKSKKWLRDVETYLLEKKQNDFFKTTEPNFGTWVAFKEDFKKNFDPADEKDEAFHKLQHLSQGNRTADEYITEFEILSDIERNTMRVPVTLGNVGSVPALIDSGAGGNFMSRATAKKFNLIPQPLEKLTPVYNADGTLNKKGYISHFVDDKIKVGTATIPTRFYLSGLGNESL